MGDIFDQQQVLIMVSQLKGVLGSLAKKGFITVDFESSDEFGNKEEQDTPNHFIWLGKAFEGNEELLKEQIKNANESK